MGHIFISYSKKDLIYAEKLINALVHEGFIPWVDVEGLGAGTHWRTRLEKQIVSCDAYLVLISRNSEASKWVKEELDVAQACNKPIFPLRLDGTKPFFGIKTIQYEDVRRGRLPSESFYQRLAAVTPRQKKTRRRRNPTDQAMKQVVEGTTRLASYYWEELSSKGKDFIAVASKKSSETFKSFANSDMVKKISATVKITNPPEKEATTRKKISSTAKKSGPPEKKKTSRKKTTK